MQRRHFLGLTAATLLAGHAARAGTAHGFSFPGIDGDQIALSSFAGRPVLVVNTASRCGFTYQYDGLQALYDRYRARGLVVLGVPSDDFGGQELDTEAEVKDFCAVNFALDFPMTAITRVSGRDAHPFYAHARAELGPDKAPRWNFHKYLMDGEGRLIAAFPSSVEPESPRITGAIEAALR